MENNFDLLEAKVKKAAETVRQLRKDNVALEGQLSEGKKRLHDAEKRLSALEKDQGASAEFTKQMEALNREVKSLRDEREEVRARIGKLVEVLDSLE